MDNAMEMVMFSFCCGTTCGAIMFVVATETTISCNLGRQSEPWAIFPTLH